MRTLLLVVGILAAFGMIGAGVYLATENAKKRQANNNTHEVAETAPGAPAPIDVSTAELENAYKANEVRADAQYKGKALRVTGQIDRITKDVLDDPHVFLRSADMFGGVMCSFKGGSSLNEIASLDRGERVTLSGVGGGYFMRSPVLERCTIEATIGPPCQVPNADSTGITANGECRNVASCTSVYYQGACEGPANVVCCVANPPTHPAPPPPAPTRPTSTNVPSKPKAPGQPKAGTIDVTPMNCSTKLIDPNDKHCQLQFCLDHGDDPRCAAE